MPYDVTKLKCWLKPSLRRKKNRVDRVLLSRKQFNRLPKASSSTKKTAFVPELKVAINRPLFYSFFKVFLYLKRLQFLIRSFYGNLREKKLNRMHRWFWKQKKKKWHEMPNRYFNIFSRQIVALLYRFFFFPRNPKFFYKNFIKGETYYVIKNYNRQYSGHSYITYPRSRVSPHLGTFQGMQLPFFKQRFLNNHLELARLPKMFLKHFKRLKQLHFIKINPFKVLWALCQWVENAALRNSVFYSKALVSSGNVTYSVNLGIKLTKTLNITSIFLKKRCHGLKKTRL